MRALVTGAGGQLGRALSGALADGCDVVPLARADLDITDDSRVRAAVADLRPGVILNCAAANAVDAVEDDPVTALAVNAFGVRSLARAAAAVDATLVHYGTDFVFDGTASEPYGEDDAPNPLSVYAVSKLLGEWFACEARHYVLRVESLFGGGGAPGPDRNGGLRGSSLDRIADALLAGREVHAFVDRVVSPSYVNDVASATLALLRVEPARGLYHCVGTGHGAWSEVATVLAAELGVDAVIRGVTLDERKLRAPRPRFSALANHKLAAAGVGMPHWRDAVARYAQTRRQSLPPARRGGSST